MLKLPRGKVSGRDPDLRMGYFFSLDWDHRRPDRYARDGSGPKLVFDPRKRLGLEFYSADKLPREVRNPRCHQFPEFEHYESQQLDNVVVRHASEGTKNELRDGLIYCEETAYHFIGRPLLETLQKQGLTGLFVSKVTQLQEYGDDWLRDDEVVMIDGKAQSFSPQFIAPVEADRCEHCGYSPLLCPGCGMMRWNELDMASICWKCSQTWLLSPDAPEAKKKKMRIQDAAPCPEPFIDAGCWDGSDFTKGPVVTRRVVDLLERLKCGSFRAEPMAADVSSLTDEQWKRLETSREPC